MSLAAATTAAATWLLHVLRALAGTLVLLLLSRRQLLQPLERFVHLLLRLLLLATLHLLVLVPHLVGFQLEQVGKVLGVRLLLSAATAATAAAHAHLHVTVDGFSAFEHLQRALFRREGLLGVSLRELLLGALHFFRGLVEVFGDDLEQRIGLRDARAIHPPRQFVDLFAQATLPQVNRGDVLAERRRRRLLPVTFGLEGRRDNVPLLLRERPRILPATAAAATCLLVLAVVATKRTDRHEVDVRRRLLATPGAGTVSGARVIRHDVTRLQTQFLEEERVTGDEILRPGSAAVIQDERFLGLAVDRVHQLHLANAEVIGCLDLDEHFLDVRRPDVTPRLPDRDRGRHVVQRIDDVFDGACDAGSILGGELDAIEAVLAHHELAHQGRVVAPLHRNRRIPFKDQASGPHRHRCANADPYARATHRGDVAAILDPLHVETRVGRIAEFEVDLPHGGQVLHRELEDAGADAAALDVVLDVRVEVEEPRRETRRIRPDTHRDPFPIGIQAPSRDDFDELAIESIEARGDLEVGALGHGGVPGLDADRVRRNLRRFLPRSRNERCPVAEVVGAKHERTHAEEGDTRQHHPGAADPRPFNGHAVSVGAQAPHGVVDESAGEPAAAIFGRRGVGGGFHRAHQGAVERGNPLLGVQSHLSVGEPTGNRPHDPSRAHGDHDQRYQDPGPGDARFTEAGPIHRDGRYPQGRDGQSEQDTESDQHVPQTPATTNQLDDS